MTSLRTFQTEIDEISHREVARQRAQATAERAKLEKDVAAKKSSGGAKAAHAHARKESTDATADATKAQTKESIPAGTVSAGTPQVGRDTMSDVDEQLQVRHRCLCLNTFGLLADTSVA